MQLHTFNQLLSCRSVITDVKSSHEEENPTDDGNKRANQKAVLKTQEAPSTGWRLGFLYCVGYLVWRQPFAVGVIDDEMIKTLLFLTTHYSYEIRTPGIP